MNRNTSLGSFLLALAAFMALPACSSDSPSGTAAKSDASSALDTGVDSQNDAGTQDVIEDSSIQDASSSDAASQKDSAPVDSGADGTVTKDSGSDAAAPGTIGATCTANADCVAGLVCIKTDSSWLAGGGPSGGYCSKKCEDSSECTVAGSKGECIFKAEWGSLGYCFEGCTPGPAISFGSFGQFDSKKCHGRKDVGCKYVTDSLGNTKNYCWPICGTDSDCNPGMRCDKSTNVCTTTQAPTGKSPVGTNCAEEYPLAAGSQSKCEGQCYQFPVSSVSCAHFCIIPCVVGRIDTCGMDENPRRGGCFPESLTMGTGDQGYCSQFCDTAKDCLDQIDKPVCNTALIHMMGRGMCYPQQDQEGTCR